MTPLPRPHCEPSRGCFEVGFRLVIAADLPLHAPVERLTDLGAAVHTVEADLGTPEGIERLKAWAAGPDALLANAGQGLGRRPRGDDHYARELVPG
jgi:hypothetical protein